MEIKTLCLGHIGTNCYLVSTEKSALVIDPGFKSETAENFLLQNKDKERLILLTHAHFDHIGGAVDLRKVTETDIAIGEHENCYLSQPDINLSNRFYAHIEPFSADVLLKDKEEITVGDLNIKTLFTAGHTVGGVCYLINGVLFSGDTLFLQSIGRTDFPGGSFEDLSESIKMLYSLLPDNTSVLPGHGEATTIGYEKRHNPFVK